MTMHDTEYLDTVEYVLQRGVHKGDRTGTGIRSVFGCEMRFDLSDGTIPLLTTKYMHIPSIIHELLWYFRGETNIKYLKEHHVRIWNEWADEHDEIGPLYGPMWRKWPDHTAACCKIAEDGTIQLNTPHIDQLQNVIDKIKTNPNDRRLVISTWNPAVLPDDNMTCAQNVANGKQALAPCHYTFQFWVNTDNNQLSCKLCQRSADLGLGVPFNIAQYSILLAIVAHITGYTPGEFIWSGGDVHIYENHVAQLKKQLQRTSYPSPNLTINNRVASIDDISYDDIVITSYEHHDPIKMEVSV